MKKFRFTLETVLKVREDKEREAQGEVTRVQAELRAVDQRIKDLRLEGEALHENLPGKAGGAVLAHDMRSYVDYFKAIGDRLEFEQDEAMRINNILAEKREILNQARRDKKAIEKLKDKRFEEWKSEVERQEGLFLDEIAILRHQGK